MGEFNTTSSGQDPVCQIEQDVLSVDGMAFITNGIMDLSTGLTYLSCAVICSSLPSTGLWLIAHLDNTCSRDDPVGAHRMQTVAFDVGSS